MSAAGNSQRDNDEDPMYPANLDLDNIISVAAVDSRNNLARFSHYGVNTVDIAAPGVEIMSTVPGGYQYDKGTSMAAPHVAGVAALVWSEKPEYSFLNVKKNILASGIKVPALEGKIVTGRTLNAYRSIIINKTPEITKINLTDAFNQPLKEKLDNGYIKVKWETTDRNEDYLFNVVVKNEQGEEIISKETSGDRQEAILLFKESGVYDILIGGKNSEFNREGDVKKIVLDVQLLEEEKNIVDTDTKNEEDSVISQPEEVIDENMTATGSTALQVIQELGLEGVTIVEEDKLETDIGTLSIDKDGKAQLIIVEDEGVYLINPHNNNFNLDETLFLGQPRQGDIDEGEIEALGTVRGLKHRGYCAGFNWGNIKLKEQGKTIWEMIAKWWNGQAVCREGIDSARVGDYVVNLIEWYPCMDGSDDFATNMEMNTYW